MLGAGGIPGMPEQGAAGGAIKMMRPLKHLTREQRLQRLGQVSVGKKRLRGDLNNLGKYLHDRCQEDGAWLFTVVLSNRTRNTDHKMEHNFHLNMRKKTSSP